jgi:hypothetical protein
LLPVLRARSPAVGKGVCVAVKREVFALSRQSASERRTMKFLLTNGTVRDLPEIVSVETEKGLLVCRSRLGVLVMTFSHSEVIAYGERLLLKNGDEDERRIGRRCDNRR